MEFINQIWRCNQCTFVFETTREFAKHLRLHLAGHRSRKFRKPADTNKTNAKNNTSLDGKSPILKFDNMTDSQFEITQPNSLLNLMNVNFETREMCKQLVDPSLVMPSKDARIEETKEFNYTEILNLEKTENNNTNSNVNGGQSTNNKLHILTKDLNLESPTKECDSVNLNLNLECATITPLNLYYIDEKNYISAIDLKNVQPNINQISLPNSVILNQGSNVVLVDNSVDETVRSMNINKGIVTGNPIKIITLNTPKDTVTNDECVCQICLKGFTKPTYLHRHLQIHIGDFTCQYCDREFARKDTWLTHSCLNKKLAEAKKDEGNEKIGISTILQKQPEVVKTISYLVPRISEDKIEKPPPVKKIYRCEICDVTIKDKSGLNKHMFTHTEVCYTCVYCDTTVKYRHSVRRHLQKYHREYEHEWSNPDFISILQTDKKLESGRKKSNAKKKKRTKKIKGEDSIKTPALSPKKDRLIGTLSDELKIKFETNSLSRSKGSQISDYLNCETSVNSIKEDSSDLLSFTKHFDDDLAHTSFQALMLPDVTSKNFTGSEILKFDSKDGVPIKSLNVSPMMLLNKNSKKSNESFLDISPEKSSSLDVDKLHKFFSTPIKDRSVFFESPNKIWSETKVMPSMPILFCDEEPISAAEQPKEVEILVCQPVPEEKLSPIKRVDRLMSSMVHHEEATPSCSAGYVLEESAKSSMQLMDTSTDFTFFVLS